MKKYLVVSAIVLLAAVYLYAPASGGSTYAAPESFSVYSSLPIGETMVTMQHAAKSSVVRKSNS